MRILFALVLLLAPHSAAANSQIGVYGQWLVLRVDLSETYTEYWAVAEALGSGGAQIIIQCGAGPLRPHYSMKIAWPGIALHYENEIEIRSGSRMYSFEVVSQNEPDLIGIDTHYSRLEIFLGLIDEGENLIVGEEENSFEFDTNGLQLAVERMSTECLIATFARLNP